MFCLPKFAADELRGKLRSGEITPEKLVKMTSAQRRSQFSFLGEENARRVNTLFEQKLILKNQEQAMVNWAKELLRMKPDVLRDTLTKVERNTEILSPEDMDLFLEDLVEQRLGVSVSLEEAGVLVDLARRVDAAKSRVPANSPAGSNERLQYGMELALFKQAVEDLKAGNMSPSLKKYLANPKEAIFDLAGSAKSILASFDNSFFGRQGIMTLFTHPDIWTKNFMKSWGDFAKVLAGGDASLAIKADVYSRPNAMNGLYTRSKLAVGLLTEEAFPSSLPTRIPILGRLFKASEQAYNGAALRVRADLADRIFAQAERNGIDVTDRVEMESLGKVINSMTGRGSVGRVEAIGREVNATFFSVKLLKGNFDTLTAHILDHNMSRYAKKQAALNLLKVVGSIGGILAIADALGNEVEWDPTSTNFGKIKVGESWVDITGGRGAIVTLIDRIRTGKYKTQKGKVFDLTSDRFGTLDKWDALVAFGEGKASPLARTIIDTLKGENFEGEKPTFKSMIEGVAVPLPIQTFNDIMASPDGADLLRVAILNGLSFIGLGVNPQRK